MEPTRFIWKDGDLVPWNEASVHVMAHALHYGTGVFEGIRAYETADGPAVFRLNDHMNRLANSALAYGIPMPWSPEDLAKAATEVVTANELQACYLRPLVFYGTASIGLNAADLETSAVIAAWRLGSYLGEEGQAHGVRVVVSSWRRFDQTMLFPNAKGTGGYLNSILANQEALRGGYDEALLLNAQGSVAEGSGENIFVVRDGAVVSPGSASGALEGITRDSVMTMLADDGIEVVSGDCARSDLYFADEVFLTGTAVEVTPVREIDGRPIGAGEPGPITRRAQELYMAAVAGELDRYRRWLDFV